MKCKCSLTVRTYECDSYGHVNNANYLNYLEFARYEFLRSIGFDYPALLKAGYGVYVARVEIDYRKSAIVDDALVIQTWSVKKGAVSGTLSQRITRGDDVIADAQVTWACVTAAGRLTRLPDAWNVAGLSPENAADTTS
jgi:acyl-CoA thioester hydrolase